jgi:hypothetical protein
MHRFPSVSRRDADLKILCTIYPSGLCLVMERLCAFGSEISDHVVQSPRTSHDIVLCRLQAVQEGEESVAESSPVYIAAHSVTLQTADICCKRTFRRSRQNYPVVENTLHGGLLSPSMGLMEMSKTMSLPLREFCRKYKAGVPVQDIVRKG